MWLYCCGCADDYGNGGDDCCDCDEDCKLKEGGSRT
jgi:hypothetical protein